MANGHGPPFEGFATDSRQHSGHRVERNLHSLQVPARQQLPSGCVFGGHRKHEKCRRLIIEASGHIIKHTIVMGDFNVRLPHHPPYVGNLGHEWGTGQYLERQIVDLHVRLPRQPTS